MKTRHAVLYMSKDNFPVDMIAWIDGSGWRKEQLPDPCYTLYDLCEVAYPRFITHLWVMPSYGEFDPVRNNQQWGISPYYNRHNRMMGASVFLRGHNRKDLDLIFPQNSAWWIENGWMKEADPQELLITLHYLEQVLKVPVGASPGRVGWKFLKFIHSEWVEDLGVDLRAMHFDNKAAGDIIWEAENVATVVAGLDGLYIHKFDKSAAYPYAAAAVDMGVGIPVHVDQDDGSAEHKKGHPQSVGVWRCTIAYSTQDVNLLLPWVWKENKGSYIATEGWLAGPIIRLLRGQGHVVHVHEGYVFPERHDLMTEWGLQLWQARVNYNHQPHWRNRKCAGFAQRAVKQIANSCVGMTAFKGFEDSDDMKRPDIRMQTIARHRELTYHNIKKMFELYGIAPAMVYMDALYYIFGNPDGRAVMPQLVHREGKFGGYKYEGCIPITPNVQAMFRESMPVAQRLEFLNKLGWALL